MAERFATRWHMYCQDKKLFYGQIDPNILVEVLDKIDRWKTARSQKENKVDSLAHERISFVDVGSGTGAALMAAGTCLLMRKLLKITITAMLDASLRPRAINCLHIWVQHLLTSPRKLGIHWYKHLLSHIHSGQYLCRHRTCPGQRVTVHGVEVSATPGWNPSYIQIIFVYQFTC